MHPGHSMNSNCSLKLPLESSRSTDIVIENLRDVEIETVARASTYNEDDIDDDKRKRAGIITRRATTRQHFRG
jgi:hypothetical protein